MDSIRRLAYSGMDLDSAVDAVMWFRSQGDDIGLEKFVLAVEERYEQMGKRK